MYYYVLRVGSAALDRHGRRRLRTNYVPPGGGRYGFALRSLSACSFGVTGEKQNDRRGTPPAPFSAARAGHRRRTAHASREPGTPSPRDRLSVVAPPTSPARYNGIQTSTIAHVDSLPNASAWGLLLCAGSKQAPARTRMAVLCSPKRPASRGPTHTPSRTRALTSHMPAGRSPAPSAWLPHRKRP